MSSSTIAVANMGNIQERGTRALINELGVVGMLRYLEQFDNGGSGDYTEERKQYLSNYTIDDIAAEIIKLRSIKGEKQMIDENAI